MTGLDALIDRRRVIVCTGTGGVGKTTTAAVIALAAARRGRRAVVVTIDPAKRLADALGLEGGLSNEPRRIDGDWDGELWALMLDTKSTFDDLVQRHAATAEQAAGILENRFYRNIAGALSGTQEYMAMEKLHELADDEKWDLIVVDTPPTRNALDFIDAPQRLTRFLDHRVFRIIVAPTRAYLKAMNVAAQAFLRTIGKVVGTEVVQDVVAFFSAFEGMEDGFRDRADAVLRLLSDPGTAFVLIAAPRPDTVAEAEFFATKLAEADIGVELLILNRMHPTFGDGTAEATRRRAAKHAGTALGAQLDNLADFRTLAAAEERSVGRLIAAVAPAPVVRVPFLDDDIHDLDGLTRVSSHLVG